LKNSFAPLPLCRSVAIGSNPIFAVLPQVDNQSAFWSLHPYVCGKKFPAFPFSRATATVATERKNGNGTTTQHSGTTELQNVNGTVETRHKVHRLPIGYINNGIACLAVLTINSHKIDFTAEIISLRITGARCMTAHRPHSQTFTLR